MISVIITVRNDSENLYKLLYSLKGLNDFKSETIVVDNFSKDNTEKICKLFNVKFYHYGPERSAQRNFGIKKSKFNYILFLDADMIVTKKFILELFSIINKKDYDTGYLNEYILANGILEKIRNYERKLYDSTTNNCPRLIRKEILKKVGYFNELITGFEDWELNNKLKKLKLNNIYFKSKVFHNEKTINFCTSIKKKTYYLLNSKNYINKTHFQQTGIFFRFFLIYFYKKNLDITMSNPVIFFLTFFYKGSQLILIVLYYFYLSIFNKEKKINS
jgi:glycosyltransferase involved in cell wall biosynthesis